jgi:hypothetical protein
MIIRVWIASKVDMACERCQSLHGRTEGQGWSMDGQPSESGWLPVGGFYGPPPLHDHCRCRIYVYSDGEEPGPTPDYPPPDHSIDPNTPPTSPPPSYVF